MFSIKGLYGGFDNTKYGIPFSFYKSLFPRLSFCRQLVEHAAVGEEFLHNLRPAAEEFGRAEGVQVGEVGFVPRQYFFIARAEIHSCRQLLRGFAPQVFEVGAGGGLRFFFLGVFIDYRHGAVRGGGVARIDDFKPSVFQFFADEVGFVFKGYEYVADVPPRETGGGCAAAVFKHRHVVQDCSGELPGLRFVAAGCFQAVTVCAEEGVAAVAAGFGIGEYGFDVRARQVVPVADVFGIAFADEENGGAGERYGFIRQARLPVWTDKAACLKRVDVGRLVHGNDVGRQAVCHR